MLVVWLILNYLIFNIFFSIFTTLKFNYEIDFNTKEIIKPFTTNFRYSFHSDPNINCL